MENKVYIDKLTIEVTHDTGSESVTPETSGNFDPDTLERNLDKKLTPGITLPPKAQFMISKGTDY